MKIEGTIYFGSNTEISVLKGVIYKIKLYIPSYWKTEDILKIYDAITGYMPNDTDKDIEKMTDDDLVPLYTYPILDALEEYYPCIKNIDRTKWNWRRIWAMNMDLHCENDTITITVNYTDQYNKVPKASVRYYITLREHIKNSTYGAQIDEYCKSDAETVNEALSKMYAERYLNEIIGKKVGEYYMNDGIEYTFKFSEDPKELKKQINAVFDVPTLEDFDKITDELKDTYIKKNHDYGNSFDKSIDKFGLTAAVVRMNDKMERLSSLLNKDAKVDESIRDTVMDLANYCIMTAMYLDNKKEK